MGISSIIVGLDVCLCAQLHLTLQPQGLQPARLLSAWDFSRQEYWSRLPFYAPGDLPNPGIEPISLASPELAGGFFPTEPPGKPVYAVQ